MIQQIATKNEPNLMSQSFIDSADILSEGSVTKNKNRVVRMPEGNNYLDRLLKNKLKRNDGIKTTEESDDYRRKSISKFKNKSQIATKRSNQ